MRINKELFLDLKCLRDSLASKRSYSVGFRSAQGGLRAGIGTLEASASEIHSVTSDSLQPHGLYSPRNSPSQNTGWVVFPFFRGSSQTRDQAQVSHTEGRFFYQLRHQGSPIYKMDLYKWCFLDTNITVCRQIGQLMAPSHEPYRQYATMQVPNGKKRSILMLLSPYIPRKFHIFEIF